MKTKDSIDDIVRLFSNYYNQLNNATVKKWIWKRAIAQRINLDDYIDNIAMYIAQSPIDLSPHLKILSPEQSYLKNGTPSDIDLDQDIVLVDDTNRLAIRNAKFNFINVINACQKKISEHLFNRLLIIFHSMTMKC